MKKWLALCLTVTFISGCGSKMDANGKNFRAALETYFEQDGQLCLAHFETWPVEVNADPFWKDRKIRIQALVDAGIASHLGTETRTGILGKQTVSRYQLTDLGRTHFRKAENTQAATTPEATKEEVGELCYGKITLDEVVKWEGPMENGKYQEAIVIYRYKIENLADWAKKPEVQTAFPDVGNIIAGNQKNELRKKVKLTSEGWEVSKSPW